MMAFRIGGSSFTQGLQLGRGIFNDAEANRRADAADKRAQDEADARAEERARARQDRADLDYIGQGGLTGIAPNMTVAPGGMGPVADPRDVDIRYQGAPGAVPVGATAPLPTAAAAAPVPGAVAPAAPVPGAAPGMSEADQTSAIGRVRLRQGDTNGFFAAQDRAKEQKFKQGYDAYAKSLMEMDDKAFDEHVHKLVTDNPKAPAKLDYDPKTMMLTVKHDDGTVQQMTRAQAMTHLMSAYEMGNGKVDKGLQQQLALYNQRQQQANTEAQTDNGLTAHVATQGLGVAKAAREDRHMGVLEKAENRKAAAAERAAAHADKPQWVQAPNMVGPNGEPMMYDARKGPTSVTPMSLPNGVRLIRDPASEIATRAEIQKRADYYLNGGEKNVAGPNKGKAMSPAEALQRAMEDFPASPGAKGAQAGGMSADQVKAAAAYLRDGNARQPSPTGGRTSQNTTIPPMPPQMVTIGGMQQVNPDYVDWQREYGDVGTLEGGETPAGAIAPRVRSLEEIARAKRTGY